MQCFYDGLACTELPSAALQWSTLWNAVLLRGACACMWDPWPRSLSHLMVCPMRHIPTKTDLKEAIRHLLSLGFVWHGRAFIDSKRYPGRSSLGSHLTYMSQAESVLFFPMLRFVASQNAILCSQMDTRKTRLSKYLHHSSLLTQTWLVLQNCKTLFSSVVRSV